MIQQMIPVLPAEHGLRHCSVPLQQLTGSDCRKLLFEPLHMVNANSQCMSHDSYALQPDRRQMHGICACHTFTLLFSLMVPSISLFSLEK